VNVALVEDNRPTLGVVGVPARDQLFVGDVVSGMARRQDAAGAHDLRARPYAGSRPTIVASRRHGGEALEGALRALEQAEGTPELRNVGRALKLCLLAEGDADVYPRLAPTSEWDTAAAQAVLEAAGGAVLQLHGAPLAYNKADILNPPFVAVADPAYGWLRYFAGR
jgi:3'(2'), 5'-bisphosphate nucleotidase